MMKNNRKLFFIIAGMLFVILAIFSAVLLFVPGDKISIFFRFAANAMFASAMFTRKEKLFGIAAIAEAARCGILMIDMETLIFFPDIVMMVLSFVGAIVVAIAVFRQKKIKDACFLYAVILAADLLLSVGVYSLTELPVFLIIIMIIVLPFVLAGFAFDGGDKQAHSTSVQVSAVSTTNQIDKLTNLKELLDEGILSKEEFDEKKKQILGL